MDINKYIDHTLLTPTATVDNIKKLCEEAKQHHFRTVCVNGGYVGIAHSELMNSKVQIAIVVGFPLGSSTTKTKLYEAKEAVDYGADEIDMVLNLGLLKSGHSDIVQDEIARVKNAIGDKVLKVIFENCYLTDEEKRIACQLSINAGADFVKTSTGFGTSGATLPDVQLMKEAVDNNVEIKASGGIRDYETAMKFIELGVSRIGTSSGVAIVTSSKNV